MIGNPTGAGDEPTAFLLDEPDEDVRMLQRAAQVLPMPCRRPPFASLDTLEVLELRVVGAMDR